MFSTLSEYIFGPSAPTAPTEENVGSMTSDGGQSQVEEQQSTDDWVIVKDEEQTFLLSSEVVTRNRVNIDEDLSRENFLIENPLSLSSEEIHIRGIKIGRKKKRKGKRSGSGDQSGGVKGRRLTPANYQALMPDLANPDDLLSRNSRVLTPSYKNNNNRSQGLTVRDKRREKYNYNRFAGTNNDRKCGKQRS